MPRFACFVALLALAVLSGCVTQTEETQVQPPFPFIRMAPVQPPAPQYEVKETPANPSGETWRPGFWDYDGINFHWVEGRLIPKPDSTAVWSADMWVRHEYGWVFVPGKWE